jgi:hypothetical protein
MVGVLDLVVVHQVLVPVVQAMPMVRLALGLIRPYQELVQHMLVEVVPVKVPM